MESTWKKCIIQLLTCPSATIMSVIIMDSFYKAYELVLSDVKYHCDPYPNFVILDNLLKLISKCIITGFLETFKSEYLWHKLNKGHLWETYCEFV